MPDDKKSNPAGKKNSSAPVAVDCEMNTGQPRQGPAKPACPDGYPDEHPQSAPAPAK